MKLIVIGVILGLATSFAAPAPVRPRAPNVVIILADDMGYGDMSAHGNTKLTTPAIDALFARSTELRQFYVTPLCAPTRASLLTGRLPLRTGVWHVWGGAETLPASERTIAHYFASEGYVTGLFGKWHNGDNFPSSPGGMGFQEHINFRDGGVRSQFNPRLDDKQRWFTAEGYTTELFNDYALDFISRHQDRPFLLYLSHPAPHAPHEAPASYLERVRQQGVGEPQAAVYAMMSSLDDSVDRLIAHLRKLNLEQNTIVVFLSDNGPEQPVRFNSGLRGLKRSLYEGGIRVPCAISWPGQVAAGRIEDLPCAVQDLLPTLAGLCGLNLKPALPFDGLDLSAWLLGLEAVSAERPLYFYQPPDIVPRPTAQPGGALRVGRFKMVNGQELYDLELDPEETRNLAEKEPERLAELNVQYEHWWRLAAAEHGFLQTVTEVGTVENPVLLKCHIGRISRGLDVLGQASGRWIRWNDTAGVVTWPINVRRNSRYLVSLQMQCAPADAGSTVEVTIGTRSLYSPVIATVVGARPEAIMPIGEFDLCSGPAELKVQVVASRSQTALELKGVFITELPAIETVER